MSLRSMFVALLLSSIIFSAGSPPAYAQPKPDAYVYVGNVVKETSLTKGTVEKIVVTVGNHSAFAPPPEVHFTAIMVISSGNQAVCQSFGSFPTLAPNTPAPTFQFALAYPPAIAQTAPLQNVEPQRSQPGGLVRKEAVPIVKSVQYTLVTRISPTKPCQEVETNCANNSITRTFQFPAGGAPSCVKFQ